MAANGKHHVISTMAELEALYADPVYPPAKVKETDRITKAYRALIEASPFFALATNGPERARLLAARRSQGLRARARRQYHRGAGPPRQQPHRQPAQSDPRSARGAAVPHSGRERDAAHHGPRHDLHRSGAVRELRHAGQGAALGAGRSRSRRCSSSAPRRSCAPSCGTRRPRSSARPCRRRARSSPRSPAARSAARSTTAPIPNGSRRRSTEAFAQRISPPSS